MTNLQPITGISPQGGPEQRLASPAAANGIRPPTTAPLSSGDANQNIPLTMAEQSTRPEPSPEELKRITGELQRRVAAVAPELQFSVDQSSGRTIIKITDPATKEVIQQIPSEQMLQIAKALDQFQQGLLLNRKA